MVFNDFLEMGYGSIASEIESKLATISMSNRPKGIEYDSLHLLIRARAEKAMANIKNEIDQTSVAIYRTQNKLEEMSNATWFSKLLATKQTKKIEQQLFTLKTTLAMLNDQRQQGIDSFQLSQLNQSQAESDIHEENRRRQIHRRAINAEQSLKPLKAEIRRFSGSRLDLETHLSGFPIYDIDYQSEEMLELEMLESYIKSLTHFLKYDAPVLMAEAPATNKAKEIWRQILMSADLRENQNLIGDGGDNFQKNTLDSLFTLIRDPSCLHQVSSVREALESCSGPRIFKTPETWLVLWTALGAGESFAAANYQSTINEDQQSAQWSKAWTNQMSKWDNNVLPALGMTKNAISTACLHFQSIKKETITGSDLIVFLSTNHQGRKYSRIAFIQFKRDLNANDQLNVYQKGMRQFKSLANTQSLASGRGVAIHCLLRNTLEGLAITPAVMVEKAETYLIASNPGKALLELTGKDCTIDWRKIGEALPTALATSLCNHSIGFSGDDEAFDWLETVIFAGRMSLNGDILIQTVGGDAQTRAFLLKNKVQELGKKNYEIVLHESPPKNSEHSGPELG